MLPELVHHIKSVTRVIYFVTEEEDRFLVQLREALKDKATQAKVYNAAFGLLPLVTYIEDWRTKSHTTDMPTLGIHDALIAIYKEPTDTRRFYILTDPDRWFADLQVQRRMLNLIHQAHNDDNTLRVIICVGSRKVIPEKLARYIEVVQDPGLTVEQIQKVVDDTCAQMNIDPPKEHDVFKGMTSFEIRASLIQTYRKTKSADLGLLSQYRLRQIRKTNLVKYIDTSSLSFDQVGGVGRFKDWAIETRSSWSKEGRDFGLEPPKGVLAVGVWGTGKSLSIKTLGAVWGLPVIQFEMGKLMSSGVGDTEANVYRALSILESMAPCIAWMDEGEKSLAGSHSSSRSDGGTTIRAIGILSNWLSETNIPVCLAMTANSLKTLPVEFINRMDERWFFDLPSEQDRIDILKIHMIKRKQDPSQLNLSMLGEVSKMLVGREIEQAIKSAMTVSFNKGYKHLDEESLAHILKRKPRVVRTMVDEIKEVLDWVGYDPDVDDGIKARFAADPSGRDIKLAIG
jgi:AAA+ superfamily predicted ATPase